MEEQAERIEYSYTYTYDQFTVFFHGDHVFVGERDRPVGQCCVDIMNLDEAVLDEKGEIDFAKFRPIAFEPAHNRYHVLKERVGNAFSDGGRLK